MRRLVLTAVIVAVTAGMVAFGLAAYADRLTAPDPSGAVAEADLASVSGEPRIVFRSTAPGDGYGTVAMVPLADPDGARAFTGVACDRVDAVPQRASCLRTVRGVLTTFEADLYDESWQRIRSWPLPGIPSRTRLSDDGTLLTSTSFVTGHSYAGGAFSTETVVRALEPGRDDPGDIEQFALVVDGERVDVADRNMWGVTFVGGDEFYATAASASLGRTWLVRGDFATRTLTAVRTNAECPSISPDRTRVAYKVDRGGQHWGVAVLDLATGEEVELGESRSVDDQVEWLDDDTVLYGLPREDETGVSDVWALDLAPGATPRILVPLAWSPSVVR